MLRAPNFTSLLLLEHIGRRAIERNGVTSNASYEMICTRTVSIEERRGASQKCVSSGRTEVQIDFVLNRL